MVASLHWSLAPGERLLWQGRPAPRCYVFRHWLYALSASVCCLCCCLWLAVLWQGAAGERTFAFVLVLICLTTYLGPGQLLVARWRWESLFYALTDQRLLIRHGNKLKSYPLGHYRAYQERVYGEDLKSIMIEFCADNVIDRASIECIEHAQLLVDQLHAIDRNLDSF